MLRSLILGAIVVILAGFAIVGAAHAEEKSLAPTMKAQIREKDPAFIFEKKGVYRIECFEKESICRQIESLLDRAVVPKSGDIAPPAPVPEVTCPQVSPPSEKASPRVGLFLLPHVFDAYFQKE